MINFWWHRAIVIATMASICLVWSPNALAAAIGAQVDNVATVSFRNGEAVTTLTTPPASFTVEALRTPSTIEFLRVSENAPDGVDVALRESQYSPSGGADPADFTGVGRATTLGGRVVDTTSPVRTAPAENFFSGELILIRVDDPGQNGDPTAVESVIATVTSGVGDAVTLRLIESGADTGVFYAYLPSTADPVVLNDPVLSIANAETLTATYQDPFVESDVSTDVAGVDPFGRLFDSVTGALLNGATVTIVDAATGAPAEVFGVDGVSAYPSTVVTGGSVTDESGLVYDLAEGEFVFPIMFPGTYRLEITPPAGYSAPSSAARDSFGGLTGAPFTIVDASYGGAFVLDGTGDVSFDVPLDPSADIILLKDASSQTGAVGDFIRYRITIENTGSNAIPVTLRDAMPEGFRYQTGTARSNGGEIPDPEISADGRGLTFSIGPVPAGGARELTYVAEIAAGAGTGEAVNSVIAVNGGGAVVSNRAEAAVFVQEDLLRSRLTIAGRVAEDACSPDEPWPREIRDGVGVPGVRLYLETGAYVVTDENGLFHFEDVEAQTHVVQIDETTIPDGYEVVQCRDDTRQAGSAISQFVDAKGGSIWRADFYLRNTDPTAPRVTARRPEGEEPAPEYRTYDKVWLNEAEPGLEWVYPAPGATPTSRSVNLGLKHDIKHSVRLFLNGDLVPGPNFSGRDVNIAGTIGLTRWRGVDLRDGENKFEAILFNQNGEEVERIARVIPFITEAARADYLPDQSRLVADGVKPPVIAVKVTDGAGRPVHKGRIVAFEVAPPYRANDLRRIENAAPLASAVSTKASVSVDAGGIARIELEPTVEAGRARLRIMLDDNRAEEVIALLEPAQREWIVVGLAEGTGKLEKTRDETGVSAREAMGEGRVALFAKGTVKEDWLVTVAVDTDEGRGERDDELFDVIDPDARFPLYGDRSVQQFEAQSRYPVYAKVENGGFQGLFGDYDTGLTDSRLGAYGRRLAGFKADYESDRFSFSGFAAQTNQEFVRDEIAADGTSGTFKLTTTPIVRNSETVTIETRDRFRPDIVLATRKLARYSDYDIDFFTGDLVFRLPAPAADGPNAFNVIVVDYETSAAVERDLAAGGRGAVRFAGGRAELGATLIHEEGRASEPGGESDLAGVDLVVDVTETTEVRLEYGVSRRETDGERERGDAILAEVVHRGENLNVNAYFQETENGFGLNQQNSSVEGARRYGLEANYRFDTFASQNSAQLGERFLDARAYREVNLETDASRTVSEIALRQEGAATSGSVGLRRVVEEPSEGERRRSLLATTALRQSFPKIGLSVYGTRDQPISGDGESNFFPKRTTVGFDQRILDGLNLNVSHEVQDGENASSANTVVGLTARPWTGSTITASSDLITQDAGRNIGATLGVDQQVQITRKWSGSFGLTRRQQLDSDGEVDPLDDIVPDDPLSPLEIDQNFTSVYVGAGYRDTATTGSARFEVRKSETGQRYTSVLGAAREISEELSFAGAARVEQDNNDLNPDRRAIDARLGAAWRPRGDGGLIAFNRFDIKTEETDGQFKSWKAVNNLAVSAKLTERAEVSVNHGFKYASFEADGIVSTGITQLAGLEGRFDITENIDIGLRGSALYAHNSGTVEYSYGPSVGVSPAKNVWISAGYNVEGFEDEDFAAAEFTRKGPFIQLRIKFDQNTAKGLLQRVSPGAAS